MNLQFILAGIVTVAIIIFLTFFKIFRKPKKLQRIQEQMKAGDVKNSIRNLRTHIIKHGGSIDAHALLGDCYRLENNFDMAVVEYRTCVKINKKPSLMSMITIREGLVDSLLKVGKTDEALSELLELSRQDPRNYRYLFEIAKIFYTKGNLEQAVTYLDKTIKYNPSHGPSLGYLGVIMYHANKIRESVVYLTQAVKYDKRNFRAYYYLGRIYMDGRDYTRSLTYFEAAQRSPDFRVRSYLQKGLCYREMEEYENAVDEFKKGISSATTRDQNVLLATRYVLANLYELRGKLAEAIEQWELINRINGNYKDVPQKLDEYQDLRADDNMKDFLVSPIPVFEGIVLEIIRHLGYDVADIRHQSSSITNVIASPNLSSMRSVTRQYVYFKIYREALSLGLNAMKTLLEEAKKVRCSKAICISPFKFRPEALEFALPRQIDLIGGDKLSKILKEIRG
jgi:tetratricopeptide (TPR) repeat protein